MNEFTDFDKICRLCASTTEILGRKSLDIFGEEGRVRSIYQKIQTCLQMMISENDPLPKTLCCSCVCTLELLDSFREKCHHSQNILMHNYLLLTGAIPPDSKYTQCNVELHMVPYAAIAKIQSTSQGTAANGEIEERNAENNEDDCDAVDISLLDIAGGSGNVSSCDVVSDDEDSDFDRSENNVVRGKHALNGTADFQTTHDENSVKRVASFLIDEYLQKQKNSKVQLEYDDQSQLQVLRTTEEKPVNVQGETDNWDKNRSLLGEFTEADGRKNTKRSHSGEEERKRKTVKFDDDGLPCVKSEILSQRGETSACTEPEMSIVMYNMDQSDPLAMPLQGAVKCSKAPPTRFSLHMTNLRRSLREGGSRAEATITQRCSSEEECCSVECIHENNVEIESNFGSSTVNNAGERIAPITENAENRSNLVEDVGRTVTHGDGAIDMRPRPRRSRRLKSDIPDVQYGATSSRKDSEKEIKRNTYRCNEVEVVDITEVPVTPARENVLRHSVCLNSSGIEEINLESSPEAREAQSLVNMSDLVLDKAFAKPSRAKSTKNKNDCNQEILEAEHVFRSSSSVVRRVSLKGVNYMCEICNKVFRSKDHYKHHMRGHKVKDPVRCEICNKPFFNADNLQEHRKLHDDINLHQCDECGKCYMHEVGLKEHMKLHSGQKPFKCDSCGKSFTYSTSLLLHRASSKGCRTDFPCDKCAQLFQSESELKHHLCSRRNEVFCDICGKDFLAERELTFHMSMHKKAKNGKKSFVCEHCGKDFARHKAWLKHKITSHSSFDNKCTLCDKEFATADVLQQHMRNHALLDSSLAENTRK